MRRHRPMLHLNCAAVTAVILAFVSVCNGKEACGTLNIDSAVTSHCFPADGSHHSVCCVDILLSDDPREFNALERLIALASKPESYSWCVCSADICEMLGGKVSWDTSNFVEQNEGATGQKSAEESNPKQTVKEEEVKSTPSLPDSSSVAVSSVAPVQSQRSAAIATVIADIAAVTAQPRHTQHEIGNAIPKDPASQGQNHRKRKENDDTSFHKKRAKTGEGWDGTRMGASRGPEKGKTGKKPGAQREEEEEVDSSVACEVCWSRGDGDRMLLCDGCDHGYHTFCLTPALLDIPDGEWYCQSCASARGSVRGESSATDTVHQAAHHKSSQEEDASDPSFEPNRAVNSEEEETAVSEFDASDTDDSEVQDGGNAESSRVQSLGDQEKDVRKGKSAERAVHKGGHDRETEVGGILMRQGTRQETRNEFAEWTLAGRVAELEKMVAALKGNPSRRHAKADVGKGNADTRENDGRRVCAPSQSSFKQPNRGRMSERAGATATESETVREVGKAYQRRQSKLEAVERRSEEGSSGRKSSVARRHGEHVGEINAAGRVGESSLEMQQDTEADELVSSSLCCEVCGSPDHEAKMLVCDRCNDGYHIFCLQPALSSIPEGDWYCVGCVGAMRDAGAEPQGGESARWQATGQEESARLERWESQETEATGGDDGSESKLEEQEEEKARFMQTRLPKYATRADGGRTWGERHVSARQPTIDAFVVKSRDENRSTAPSLTVPREEVREDPTGVVGCPRCGQLVQRKFVDSHIREYGRRGVCARQLGAIQVFTEPAATNAHPSRQRASSAQQSHSPASGYAPYGRGTVGLSRRGTEAGRSRARQAVDVVEPLHEEQDDDPWQEISMSTATDNALRRQPIAIPRQRAGIPAAGTRVSGEVLAFSRPKTPPVLGLAVKPCRALERESCVVCLEPLLVDTVILRCKHVFHSTCITKWALERENIRDAQCPVCRRSIAA